MTTIGVLGRPWRATVTPWGAVQPWDGSAALDWWVAADDRWHVPASEPTLRQRRIDGTPVIETRVKVPGGDVVHRVAAIADGNGMTLVEIENDSSLPVAVAIGPVPVLTARPPSAVPIQGIDLPDGVTVLPIGHHGTVRVAVAHDAPVAGALPDDLPPLAAVVRGWIAQIERASRLVLPDAAEAAMVAAARSDAALATPPDPEAEPIEFLLAQHERCRLGEPAEHATADVATAAERIARDAARHGLTWDADRALVAAGALLDAAAEHRGAADVADLRRRLAPAAARPVAAPGGIRDVAWVEDLLVRPTPDGGCTLLPDGFPDAWLGVAVECYRASGGGPATVSFAIRWHGERPALLWEIHGSPSVAVHCGADAAWSSCDARGEALLAAPRP